MAGHSKVSYKVRAQESLLQSLCLILREIKDHTSTFIMKFLSYIQYIVCQEKKAYYI